MQKHTLLAVTGMSPQVITESVYAFHMQGQVIDNIKIITTTRGKKEIWLNLMVGKDNQPAMLQQLINDYNLPLIHFTKEDILVVTDEQGNELNDARTEKEHEAMADYITQVVQQQTNQQNHVLHASIAGGRKTMTFLLGYAMSLYARQTDTLSHVLVEEAYEHSDFYYPTPYSKPIRTRMGTTEDAKDATVTLAMLPFVRMRQELPKNLLAGKVSYSDAVNSLNLVHQQYTLNVDLTKRTLQVADFNVTLSPIDFAFYYWVLDKKIKQNISITPPQSNNPSESYATDFIKYYAQFSDYMVAEELLNTSFKHDHEIGMGMGMEYFSERKARVNKKIVDAMSTQLAQQIGIYHLKNDAAKKQKAFTIAVPENRITIITS